MKRIILLIVVLIVNGCSMYGNGNNPPPPPTPVVKLYPEWTEIQTEVMPPARWRHTMAYDSDKEVVLLFGGRSDETTYSNDTWMFDGVEWTELHPAVSPPGRYGMRMVYDPERYLFIMAGGSVEGPDRPPDLDTWEFDYNTWQEVTIAHKPPNRAAAAMVYHPLDKCTYIFGGVHSYDPVTTVFRNDMWRYDGTDWTEVETEHSPSERRRCEMVYDSNRNCLVLFGGDDMALYFNDTWEFNGTDWELITTEKNPPPRSYYGFTYDSTVSLTILFGGYRWIKFNDTWAYDGTNWRKIETETSPEKRVPVMVYNEARHESFIFSGLNADGRKNIEDQWVFKYKSD